MLSPQALRDFKRIWREERGSEIADDLAVAEATNLLTLFATIYRPLRREWVEENDYENNRKYSEQ